MKIGLISDVHNEFASTSIPKLEEEVDVLIVAGDCDAAKHSLKTALEIANGKAEIVLSIAGNHEFYGERIDKGIRIMREKEAALQEAGHKIFFLDGDSIVFKDVTFIGGTLWTDYNLYHTRDISAMAAQFGLNDFRRIRWHDPRTGSYRRLAPGDIMREHSRHRNVIETVLRTATTEKKVVISHHGPLQSSLDPVFANSMDPLNPAYASHLNEIFWGPNPPNLWVHGHVHCNHDFVENETRVVVNPWGYPGQLPNQAIKIIEV